jgi:hypothetical protein
MKATISRVFRFYMGGNVTTLMLVNFVAYGQRTDVECGVNVRQRLILAL